MIPPEVQALADQRADARSSKDFAASDALRDQINSLGWGVKDTADGQVLTELPPYPLLRELPDRSAETTPGVAVSLIAEGWPDDVRACLDALLEHSDAQVVVLDNGVGFTDDRVEVLHVENPLGFAAARNALVKACTAELQVMMDVSTVLEGPAIQQLADALGPYAASGWKGVSVDDGWLSFSDAPPGEVEALLGYLTLVRRQAALDVPLPAKARFYRNVDLEWSFLLREAGHRLVAVDVPVRQDRHHGYHDSDPELRDRESKKTYDRFLQRFRGRDELRITRSGDQ